MTKIVFGEDQTFSIDGERFVIDMRPQGRRPSNEAGFTIVKNQGYIRFYEAISTFVKPKTILELGVFEGGSYVFFDKLFKPSRMSAIDLRQQPVDVLLSYVKREPNRHVHFGTSQSDAAALRQIVADDLGGILDLVIDDASHAYEHTKASFEILFPLLSPGGTYVIEDWSWAHQYGYQGANAPLANRPALTNLLFEQLLLLASSSLIAEIRVRKPLYMIHRSHVEMPPNETLWDKCLLRGRNYFHI